MTATHDRRRDPHVGVDPIAEWEQRSAFGAAKGWPWWAVVVLALAKPWTLLSVSMLCWSVGGNSVSVCSSWASLAAIWTMAER